MSALAQDRPYIRSAGDEPLPGYRLIAPLGMGGFGEVWKCIAPGGLHKAIKFVFEERDEATSTEPTSLQQEYEAFERVKVIRHPFLLTLERVELIGGELVMVMELADKSLGNRYDECREAGEPGIPRTELLSYMVDAAEALDVLGREHGLQHLDVKPANLFLLGGHVKVGDYGLVARHKTGHTGEEPKLGRGLTPKYVAPEILYDRVHARSDQYPLGLVYAELLTGVFPYSGRSARQLLLQHTSCEPDLSALPSGDREAVGRALSKDPAGRFPSCLSFVKALLATGDTKILSTTMRQLPRSAPSIDLPSARPALVTPSTRNSAPTPVDATQRLSPTLANYAETQALSEQAYEFNRAHPGWSYAAEAPATPRGRVVRASDATGAFYAVHLLKIPTDADPKCEAIGAALSQQSGRIAIQTVVRPHSHLVSFAIPEGCPTLKDWLGRRKIADEPALRRTEIRSILAPVAAALDALQSGCGFPHGLLSPSTIVQKAGTWGVALYGMGELLRRTRPELDWMQAEAYCAPEASAGQPESTSDQYSLALIFLELTGAWSPPERRNHRVDRSSLAFRFNRDVLLDCEALAVKRAMAARSENRFRSCTEFLTALEPPVSAGVTLEEVCAVESLGRLAGKKSPADRPPAPESLTDALLKAAGALNVVSWPSAKSESLVIKLSDGRFTSRFPVKLSSELALLKLNAFRDQHGLELMKWTAETYALKPRMGSPRGGGPGVELVVQLPNRVVAGADELVVTGRPVGSGDRAKADAAVIQLIEQFRRSIQNTGERRKASRFPTDMPIVAYPVSDELAVQSPITGTCRDVSATGFSCFLNGAPTTGHAFVTFPGIAEFASWALLARVIRSNPTRPGQVLLAGRFVHAGD